jgi:hypothetical protein
MFNGRLILPDGSELLDIESGKLYEIRATPPAGTPGKLARGIGVVHHTTYSIRLKKTGNFERAEDTGGGQADG